VMCQPIQESAARLAEGQITLNCTANPGSQRPLHRQLTTNVFLMGNIDKIRHLPD